jgi:hypothetical protein
MTTTAVSTPGPYPVDIAVDPVIEGRNRLTTGFRFILVIPHQIWVGVTNVGSAGVLGAVALVCAVISWFAIVFTGEEPRGLWDLRHFYMRWRLRAIAYFYLLRDEYPPFGDGDYPATLQLEWPDAPRDRVSVGLRLIYAIPHIIIVAVLVLAALVCALISWFAIVFTGQMPEGLAGFIRNVVRWWTRVEAYTLLMRDEYPPFSLSE